MRSKIVLAVAGLVLPVILTIAIVGQVSSSSSSIQDVQAPVLRDVNTAPIPGRSSTFKPTKRNPKTQLACFAGSLGACEYDGDCCNALVGCVYLNVCGGYCCY